MCVLVVAASDHPRYDLVVAANRDEFHDRPAAPAGPWPGLPGVYAGQDLEAGGTWLGVDTHGRFAAVTNVRGGSLGAGELSRGFLVRDFLGDPTASASGFASSLEPHARRYAGVNFLAFDDLAGAAWSNMTAGVQSVSTGVYGLSNGKFDEDWPKTARLKQGYAALRHLAGEPLIDALLALLRDRALPHDPALPDTGVGLERERWLAPVFIEGEAYGTRCSTVVLRERRARLWLVERRYDARGKTLGESRFVLPLQRHGRHAVTAPDR